MAMKPCRECKKEISTDAKACPNCGKKNPTVGLGQQIVAGVLSLLFALWVFGKFENTSGQQEGSSERQSLLYRLFGTLGSAGTTKNSDSLTFVPDSCFDLSTKFGVASKLSEVQKDEAWKAYRGKAFDWHLKIVDVSALPVVGGFLVQAKCSPRSPSLIADIQLKYGSDAKPFVMQLQVGSSTTLRGAFTETSTLFGLTADGLFTSAPTDAATSADTKPDSSKGTATAVTAKPNEEVTAFQKTKSAAENGDLQAQLSMGLRYLNGQDVAKDDREAVKWFRIGAEKGFPPAQTMLASMYNFGQGVPKNYAEGLKWNRKAAEQGYDLGAANLGAMYRDAQGVAQDYAEALRWFRKAAEHGNPEAQNSLAAMYLSGNGVPQDAAEGIRWFREAATNGSEVAQYNLGIVYDTGKGVPQDSVEAVKWYRKAADQDYGDAQQNLGAKYANGQGVTQSSVEAYKWASLAAAHGNANAAGNRDVLKAHMTSTEIAEAEKLAREWEPVVNGD